MEKASKYKFDPCNDESDSVFLCGLFSEHILQVGTWRCNGEFAVSMSLPCRHAIAYRKLKGVAGHLIPWNRLDERWATSSQQLKKVK